MPWTAKDAPRFNKATAGQPALQQLWAETANKALREYGDEGRAIQIANAAVRKSGQVK
jgi:hypothetical protein